MAPPEDLPTEMANDYKWEWDEGSAKHLTKINKDLRLLLMDARRFCRSRFTIEKVTAQQVKLTPEDGDAQFMAGSITTLGAIRGTRVEWDAEGSLLKLQ